MNEPTRSAPMDPATVLRPLLSERLYGRLQRLDLLRPLEPGEAERFRALNRWERLELFAALKKLQRTVWEPDTKAVGLDRLIIPVPEDL